MLGLASWSFTTKPPLQVVKVLGGCLVVALAEEALFRGILLNHLVGVLGKAKGFALCSLVFAAVHLFRPGTWSFKLCYGLGLVLLAYLLAAIFDCHCSILASAGFHAGVILPNFFLQKQSFQESFWAGWNGEVVSGAVCWLALGIWGSLWMVWFNRRRRDKSKRVSLS